jgi:hypothetical protein
MDRKRYCSSLDTHREAEFARDVLVPTCTCDDHGESRTRLLRRRVYQDAACTNPMIHSDYTPNMTMAPCFVGTYVDPMGRSQTNANADFDCTATGVTWTQWPGSDTCRPTVPSLCINATLSTACTGVRTHMGLTYQKLINYTGCSAKYSGRRCPSTSAR